MSERLGIISGCDHDRTLAAANHQYYANQQGLCYIYDTAPTGQGGYSYKLEKIAKFLSYDLFEWLFWIDDDGLFMQYDKSLTDFLDENSGPDLIFCKSPVNTFEGREIQTYISSGNFFIRNSQRSRDFIDAVRQVSLEEVKAWWNEDELGFYSNGDQDAMIYLLKTDERFSSGDFYTRLPYTAFNCRPFHFIERPDEHFLVHFTGEKKGEQIQAFAERFQLSEALIPSTELEKMHGLREPQVRYTKLHE
jgi:hypothetical protein